MKNIFDLSGKRVLITGSGRGIGFLLAKGLGDYGAEIIINDLNQEVVVQAVEQLKSHSIVATGIAFDVSDKKQVVDSLYQIESEIGAIDILINNAGIQRRHSLIEFPEKDWDDIIDINQKSVFLLSQEIAKYMIPRGKGKIINICSMQSELGRETITPYAASKGAVKMLTKGLCVELAKHNIQVNGIGPGYFDTEMTKALVNDEAFSSWLFTRTPAARWGKPEELVGAAIYLSSSASDFVNGHIIYVDGGILASI
ncbi:TPA: gluconate 5-dehydrogenase [Escherichia coli]|uniref:gluconate 5-dehydrogenase n=1 Tax=Escherichia coli TaxID=562 RepID=UPI0017A14D81|nr:gluconate 5-dehydrogenase [Escherichia coli]EFE5709629.1 gluconate 5-dehydrogenase [Escherichia coli]EFI6626314.1 gluconate 5-dehydrogenase [Escherichia coli]EFL2148281.1 gluconate 5-dehydrogenase [Escherichia coli]EGA3983901.1 gluconate 5-dehydrogenase [Escherichia coli]EGK5834416.1 gluconate 5-dehydrogenase [Escherichia coli]